MDNTEFREREAVKKIAVVAAVAVAAVLGSASPVHAQIPRRPLCTQVSMPDVLGQDEQSAVAELNAAGITDIYINWNKEALTFVVLLSDPAAGTQFYPCQKTVQLYLGE